MNKQTIVLPGQQVEWGSYISKYQPDSQKVLDNMFTSGSKNFVTDQTGMIDKRQGGVAWNRTSFSGPASDSYEAVFESGARHYLRVGQGTLSASTGNGLFTTITSGYSTVGNFEWATTQDRVYGDNGINPPQVYDTVTSYGGVSYSFTTGKTKVMGAQPPVSAPTASTPTPGGSVPVGPHRYEVTFLYYGSEESNGSPSSSTQTTTSGNQTIPLTNIPIGGYGVTARNIYRDNNDGNFLLLTTIGDNTTTSFNDTLAQGATPTPIPTNNFPPPTFSKIALWLDSLWITPTGETNTLRYSNAGSPDIFDPDNFIVCQSDDTITAITVYNGKLYVHGLHSFGSIEGTTPDTFFYNSISRTIGCTDNRSIQIRSIVSVPTLWWLSDKGLYYSNGYTVEYGSDLIQDLVNLNLAQVNYSTNKNTQNSQAQYAGDTFTPGIDITSIPGTITTMSPEADYSQTSDWLGGSVVTNLKTGDSNFAEVPTKFSPSFSSGSETNIVEVSGNITTPVAADNTGSSTTGPVVVIQNQPFEVFEKFVFPRSGTISSITTSWSLLLSQGFKFQIRSNSGGAPGSVLISDSLRNEGTVTSTQTSAFGGFFVTGGVTYWIGVTKATTGTFSSITQASPGVTGSQGVVLVNNGVFQPAMTSGGATITATITSYVFSQAPVAASGTYVSTIYNTLANAAIAATISHTGVFPSPSSSTTTVDGSNIADLSTGIVTQSFGSLNGTASISLAGKRYWRITIQLSTTDDRVTAQVGPPTLTFSTTATWVSQPINATSDNTGWNTLTFSGNVPSGTSVSVAIATSPDNITYSSFGPIGSALTEPWAKIQFILSTDAGDTTSPSLSEITLTWNLTSQIESSAIDTGTTPAGFSTMQYVQSNMPEGTLTMYIRTASTAPGLSSASYVLVPNGTFPNLTPQEFVQWKLVFMSSVNSVSQVTSVTVNWFIGSGTTGVRVASLFYNKTYYLSAATIGSTFNNVLIQLDQFGKFRIQKDNSVGTLLLYFNTLYFTDGRNGNIYNGFIAPTDNGTPIVMDVRTKAWSSTDNIFLKIPRGFKVTGISTGTTIHAYYSSDRGNTWTEMLNENGVTGFTTSASGLEFVVLFVPDANTLNSGRTLMYRLVSSDSIPCSIINFEPSMYTRKARYLANG